MKIMSKALLIFALVAGIAYADALTDRQTAMKTIGQTLKGLTAMGNGEIDFDAAAAETGLLQIEATAAMLPDLFPEGSNTGDTEAAPAIWENRAKFDEVMAKFVGDTKMEAAPADATALDAKLDVIWTNCKSCHADFRIQK